MKRQGIIPRSVFLHLCKTGTGLCTIASLWLALFASSASAQTPTYSPLFQFAIFYNLDLDISPGQPMNITGPVFCNGNIWLWPYAAMTFNSTVSSAMLVTNKMQPYDQQSSSGYTAPSYTLAGQPQSHVAPLFMPIGTNNSPSSAEDIIKLPPPNLGAPNPAAYSPTGEVYLFNEVDLIISNSAIGFSTGRGTNITIWFQDPNNINPLTQLQPNVTNVVGTVTNRYFSFVTNVQFYDFRESDTVQAVQVDVAKLNSWLTNTSGTGGNQYNQLSFLDKYHGIDSVFIYNNVPQTSSQLPAVRLVNGAQLPYTTVFNGGFNTGGLTVVTPQPLYVKGNYNVQTATSAAGASAGTTNTAYTYPAALMSDAITILSANWNDTGVAYQASGSLSSRIPASTTINAACLEGIVQSTNDSGGSLHYSGGVENFLRLEENWTSSTILTYNGSITALFPSQYATNFWQTPGNYYNPPTRHWAFDLNFTDPNKLPALTPMVGYHFPAIFSQPQSQTVLSGSNVTFSVIASSLSQLSYQWQLNGTNIPGGTSATIFTTNTNGLFSYASLFTLTLTNVQSSQAGNYSLQITNIFGLTNSSNAVLTVGMPPTITSQPTNQMVQEGNAVTFSVSASGSPPLSYQWSDNGTPLFGHTTNSFTLTIVSNAQFTGSMVLGTFQVVITNLYGSVTSSNAVLSTYMTTTPALDTPAFSGGNQIQFDVAGVSGFNYAVQASTNMIDWEPLFSNTAPFTFTDTNAPDFPERFYRSVYLP